MWWIFWIFCWSLLPGGGACGLIALSLSARPLHFLFFSLDPPPSLTLNTKIELEIHFIEIYMKKNYGHVTRMRSNEVKFRMALLAVVTLTVISPVHAILPNQISNSGQYSQEFLAAFEKRLLQVWPFNDLWLTRVHARDLGLSTNLYPTINDLGGIILIFFMTKKIYISRTIISQSLFLVIFRCTSG